MKYFIIKEISSNLRKNQTKEEKILWKYLRNKQIRWERFLRQHPIFIYKENNWTKRFCIPDFYNHKNKLIIEVDWGIHNLTKEYDNIKDEILINNWFKIIRIKNHEVNTNIKLVLKKIENELI